MILSEKEIRAYSKKQDMPLIDPFFEKQLQGASYDVSMSSNIAILKNAGKVIDPLDDEDLSGLYEKKNIGREGYLLTPGEYILVELREKIQIPNKMVAFIRPRTRFTRMGILIAEQYCNPTYEGILYIGVFNAGVNSFLLRPEIQIAQIIFEEIESVPDETKLYKNKINAVYNQEKGFRPSKFGEAGWSYEMKKTYQGILTSLSEGN